MSHAHTCAYCGKALAGYQLKLFAHGKAFCSNEHWNRYHNAPTFDPRKLRPQAHHGQQKTN